MTARLSAPRRVIINPASFRMSRAGRLQRIMRLLDRYGVRPDFTSAPDTIAKLLAAHSPDDGPVVVLGGDGTIQAAATWLATQPEPQRPVILALGGGRTNYIAADLRTRRPIVALLERALNDPTRLRIATRHSIEVTQGDQPAAHAFFIAGATVDEVIRDCHAFRSSGPGRWRQGYASTAIRLSQLAIALALGRRRLHAPALSVEGEGLGELGGPMRVLILSSLHHQHGWPRPYLSQGEGEIAVTAITDSAQRFWRRLPGLLNGRSHHDLVPSQGYLSGRSRQITVTGIQQLCLDGQETDFDPEQAVVFRPGPALAFVTP